MFKKNSGFTLVEMLAVLGIVILITLVSIPSFTGFQRSQKLKNQTGELAADLRLAQQYAISEQVVYNVVFNPSHTINSYQIIKSSTGAVVKTITLDREVRISEITGLANNTVQYVDTGGVVLAGTVYLVNTQNQTTTLRIKPSGYVENNN